MTADIIAYDSENNPVLLVEVKNQKGLNDTSVENIKKRLRDEGFLSNGKYFLLALPDKFYLWKNLNNLKPDYSVSADLLLKPYYPSNSKFANNLSSESFEIIVSAWLRSILLAENKNDIEDNNQKWLIESGLFDKLKNGHVILEGKHWVV